MAARSSFPALRRCDHRRSTRARRRGRDVGCYCCADQHEDDDREYKRSEPDVHDDADGQTLTNLRTDERQQEFQRQRVVATSGERVWRHPDDRLHRCAQGSLDNELGLRFPEFIEDDDVLLQLNGVFRGVSSAGIGDVHGIVQCIRIRVDIGQWILAQEAPGLRVVVASVKEVEARARVELLADVRQSIRNRA